MTTTTTFAQISTMELTKLAQSRVSRSAILVYVAISSHLRGFEGKTTAFPSIKRIMALLGGSVARSTIFEALKQLKEAGLIKTERTTERKANTYHLKLREVIQRAVAFIDSQKSNPKQRGPRSQTQGPRSQTQKRASKRESFIDWDTIMFEWIKQGKTPAAEVIAKIPHHQKKWLKTYHPHIYERVV